MEKVLIELKNLTDKRIGGNDNGSIRKENAECHKNYNEDIESVIKKLDKEIDDYKLYERHLTSIYELMELGIKITALAYN